MSQTGALRELRFDPGARLERRLTPEVHAKSAESYRRRLAAIEEAQRESKVSELKRERDAQRREAITEALRRILTDGGN